MPKVELTDALQELLTKPPLLILDDAIEMLTTLREQLDLAAGTVRQAAGLAISDRQQWPVKVTLNDYEPTINVDSGEVVRGILQEALSKLDNTAKILILIRKGSLGEGEASVVHWIWETIKELRKVIPEHKDEDVV